MLGCCAGGDARSFVPHSLGSWRVVVRIHVIVGLADHHLRRKGSGPFVSRSFLAPGNRTFTFGSVCSAAEPEAETGRSSRTPSGPTSGERSAKLA